MKGAAVLLALMALFSVGCSCKTQVVVMQGSSVNKGGKLPLGVLLVTKQDLKENPGLQNRSLSGHQVWKQMRGANSKFQLAASQIAVFSDPSPASQVYQASAINYDVLRGAVRQNGQFDFELTADCACGSEAVLLVAGEFDTDEPVLRIPIENDGVYRIGVGNGLQVR